MSLRGVRRRHLISLIAVLLLLLLVYLGFTFYELYEGVVRDYEAEGLSVVEQRMGKLVVEINDFPRDEGDDVLYLANSGSLRKYINSDGFDEDLLEDLQLDFLAFMEVNEVYYQLRYIDEVGDEVVRVEFDGEDYFVADEDDLQNKFSSYYFSEAMLLNEGEIYVSKLDLSLEDGVVDVDADGEYIPVLRYAVHVFDEDGVDRGIVILSVYADYFLEDIRRLGGVGEESFLIDNDGYYLANSNRSKEFSFMFDGRYSFVGEYFDASESVLSCDDERVYENEDYVFVYRHIHPTSGTFEMYQGSESVFGEHAEDDYFWVLVNVLDKDYLNEGVDRIGSRFIVFGLVVLLILLLILILLLLILRLSGGRC